jgi:hypothetical protein
MENLKEQYPVSKGQAYSNYIGRYLHLGHTEGTRINRTTSSTQTDITQSIAIDIFEGV